MPNPLHLINYACATCQANLCLQRLNDVDPSFEPIFCLCTNLADLACALRRHRPWALLALAQEVRRYWASFPVPVGLSTRSYLPARFVLLSICCCALLLGSGALCRGLGSGAAPPTASSETAARLVLPVGASLRPWTVAEPSQWLPRL